MNCTLSLATPKRDFRQRKRKREEKEKEGEGGREGEVEANLLAS